MRTFACAAAWLLTFLGCGSATWAAATEPVVPTVGEWDFQVFLDGKPIGEHRFSVSEQGDERKVSSQAQFAVKVLGITAYRYRHEASEQWRGGCLVTLKATTNDDGKRTDVLIENGDSTRPSAGTNLSSGSASPSSCLMSFAYWNPAIQTQTQLLNAQTGKLESVKITPAAGGSIEVQGRTVSANRLRIVGTEQPIDVWYSTQGQWIGLDSMVAGGRTLSYRLSK
jgi:Family of unknown function (DUF6134)